ncbi:MAG: ABC transporter ATP-binding protein [Eubacterium sp.]|nr:ABC transporter ATP-binding protein [Eubacterium sp.]
MAEQRRTGADKRAMAMQGARPVSSKGTIRRLMGYMKDEKLKLILSVICVIVSSATMLIGSYMLKPIMDQLADSAASIAGASGDVTPMISEAVSSLAGMLLIMMGVYAAGIMSMYLQMRLMIGVSQRILIRIRKELFDHLQKLPVRYFDTNSTGDIMSRFTNDVDAVGELMNNTFTQLISGVINIVGTLFIMLTENIWLSLVTILMTPLMLVAATGIAKRSSNYYRTQQQALGAINGYIEETVTGQKVVKVFCHEKQAIDDFDEKNTELRIAQTKAQFFGGILMPVMGNIGQICYALTATIGGLMCLGGSLTIGGLTIFVNYSRQFSRPINELSMQVNTIFSALAGAERVFTVMDTEPETPDAKDAVDMPDENVEVVFDSVSFGYKQNQTVLKDINLKAAPGDKVAFVGSTGAGKTTITNLLNRFYDIDEGSITIAGRDIKAYKRDSLRSSIAMVLQDTHLFSGTVRENIRYGRPSATDEEVIQAAKTASAHSFIMRLENGYDTEIEGDGMNLSQGQRQLLNIARAAISKAPVLVLDEATSSVDTRTEMHIDHGMARLMKGRTTFVIAHRLSTVRNADMIMVLEDGKIIERGTHRELIEQGGRYYQLYTGAIELS